MSVIREIIERRFRAALEVRGVEVPEVLEPERALLGSGVDSLGFAMLVVQLEQDLGFDPFVLSREPVYPRTFGDLVSLYERVSSGSEDG